MLPGLIGCLAADKRGYKLGSMRFDIDRREFLQATALGSAALLRPLTLSAAAEPSNWNPPPPDIERRVKVRGGHIYVRANGNLKGNRAPVLMLHGGPGYNHADFLAVLKLADERAVILYDQLDAGLSDQPNDPVNWSVERFVSEIDAIRASFDLNQLHLVGHSWGSALAMQYAGRQPAGLMSLTVSGPYFSTRSWEASTLEEIGTLAGPVREAINEHERAGTTKDPAYQDAIGVYYKRYLERRPEPDYVTKYKQRTGIKLAPVVYQGMWGPAEIRSSGILRTYDGESLLGEIGVPTLVICGEYDEMSPAAAAPLAKRIRDARLIVVPDSGHMVSLDQPEIYVQTIRLHLARADQVSAKARG
jgi:L-proline amide hydrolase